MNFLFPDLNVVFIHLPKNAGSSIRSVMGKNCTGPAGGSIPKDWRQFPSFAVIREPLGRFLSGVNMFRVGAENTPGSDYYSLPRMPKLNISQALDILEDGSIPYDRSIRSDQANLKHHLWPQTHPFNCLSDADHILRYENLENDFKKLCADIGISTALPKVRHSRQSQHRLTFNDITANDYYRLRKIYADDFDILGYDPQQSSKKLLHLSRRERLRLETEMERLAAAWPRYFNVENSSPDKPAGANELPSPDIDLEVFYTTTVPGVSQKNWLGRERSLLDHFHMLEPEFGGRSRIAHLMASAIVVLRRDAGNEDAKKLFFRILNECPDIVSRNMNSRWLTSVCDTVADIADNELDRLLGLTGTLFANTIKFSETERKFYYPPRPWPPQRRIGKAENIYDGVFTFWVKGGDSMKNLMGRVEKVLEIDRPAALFVKELVLRAMEGDTVYARLSSIAGRNTPFAKQDYVKRIKSMMKDL
ncbi:sulfotransferase family 2 domain-containing protein [Paracoccus sp. TOH]|uniref:sulfotransferase family 2 domain-containing protein n=1 Tax=Paracoccus sp. TOH TaxID=1263728 RepID=UPI0025AFB0A7|nr:sulfotransferase family 2 domain-containing protein [Paracoccus sp. TOH]WJS86336.1 sulfotransferase family protein [Paracoccus sp. TOH]